MFHFSFHRPGQLCVSNSLTHRHAGEPDSTRTGPHRVSYSTLWFILVLTSPGSRGAPWWDVYPGTCVCVYVPVSGGDMTAHVLPLKRNDQGCMYQFFKSKLFLSLIYLIEEKLVTARVHWSARVLGCFYFICSVTSVFYLFFRVSVIFFYLWWRRYFFLA